MTSLNLTLRLLGRDSGAFGLVDRLRNRMRTVEREDEARHRRAMSRVDGVLSGYRRIGSAMRDAYVAGMGLAGTFLGAGLVGIVRTTAQFEKYEAVLTGLEGSQARAKASMAWVQNFAATTPYEIDQVMEAFVRLRAYGIDPTDGTLRTLGDTASTMGKSIMDAVEMMADAQSGEFERLKEFGIRARQEGNRVTFSWVETGKTIERSTAKSGAEITKTLMGILGPRNTGAMDRQSRTLGGMWSGLMDYFTNFKVMIADAGLADFMRAEMTGFMAAMKTPEGQAQARALASEISAALVDGIREVRAALQGVDVGDLIKGLVSIVTFIPKVIQFFGGLSGVITTLGSLGLAKIGFDLGMLAVTIGGLAGIAAAPIALVAGILTVIAVAAFLIYRNWGGIKRFFSGIWNGIVSAWNAAPAFFSRLWTRLKPIFAAGARALWNSLPSWLRVIMRGGAFVLKVIGQGIGAAAAATRNAAAPGTAERLAGPGVQPGRGGSPNGPPRVQQPIRAPRIQPGRGGSPHAMDVRITTRHDGPPSVDVKATSGVRVQPGRGAPARGPVRPR